MAFIAPRLPKEEQLQMILKTDDWELDARDVTLGAEVGQGAFGLVMTGYYQNNQVAIKVLKGQWRTTHNYTYSVCGIT